MSTEVESGGSVPSVEPDLDLQSFVSRFVQLAYRGKEAGAKCCFCDSAGHSLRIGATSWRTFCCCQHDEHGADAAGFYASWCDITREEAIAKLGNGAGLPDAKPIAQAPLKRLPFWGCHALAKRPDARVWIHELSGSVLVWRELLPDRVHLGMIQGRSWEELAVVAGRKVVLVPEANEASARRMAGLAACLYQDGHVQVMRLDTGGELPGPDEDAYAWAKARSRPYEPNAAPESDPALSKPPDTADQEAAPVDTEVAAPPIKTQPRAPTQAGRGGNGQDGPPLTPEQRVAAQAQAARAEVLSGMVYTCIAAVRPEAVKWLWPGRIPLGELTMVVGDPGLGKSQICASLASVVTNGGLWPVDRTPAEQGSVLILSAEDNIRHTIRPRLDAAGADVARCHTLQAIKRQAEDGTEFLGSFDLARDIAKLSILMDELQDVRMVIVDPVSAYLGETDSHKNAEVRGMLAPLTTLAGAHNAAIILVSHLTKSQSANALMRVQGSIAFAALCRAVWGVTADKEDRQRRLFMPLKNNLGQDKTGLAYAIEAYTLDTPDEPIPTSRVMWEGQLVETSVDEAFGAALTHEERAEMGDAKDFLREALSQGRVKASEVQRAAKSAGHSLSTLNRAKKALSVQSEREGFGKNAVWFWTIAEQREPAPDPGAWLPKD